MVVFPLLFSLATGPAVVWQLLAVLVLLFSAYRLGIIMFLVCAGISVPGWARLNRRIGPRSVLLIAMPLAVARFVGAAFLGPGSALAFAAVCVASGATLGADMVILPAMFSVALTQAGLSASQPFGLWSFAGKLGLALAAFLILPVPQTFGFTPPARKIPTQPCVRSPWPMPSCPAC